MNQRTTIGQNGPSTHPVGYGGMVLEGYYGKSDDDAALVTLGQALDLGMHLDTADAYGNGHNEALIAKAIRDRRDESFVATKFGIVFEKGESYTERPTGWNFNLRLNGTPEYAQRALERSLERLGVDCIDLWYLHWPDPSTPIEESVGAMAEAVSAGKVRQIGLSNVTADELRRANAVHPIAAVQYEYSLWRREPQRELLSTVRELGATLVAWSPLGAGFLAGTVDSVEKGDFRRANPRFSSENLEVNRDRFAPLAALAVELGLTPAQLALAWLTNQPNVIPIPGSRRTERILENAKAAEFELDEATSKRIDELAQAGLAQGDTIIG